VLAVVAAAGADDLTIAQARILARVGDTHTRGQGAYGAKDLLDALGWPAAHVLGGSFGGVVAQRTHM
jgi:pimeloyl-ACP methyl ester carboxylesterase